MILKDLLVILNCDYDLIVEGVRLVNNDINEMPKSIKEAEIKDIKLDKKLEIYL